MERSEPLNAKQLRFHRIVESIIWACVFLLGSPKMFLAQQGQSEWEVDKEQLVTKVRSCDEDAILEAGRSGQRSFVAVLQGSIPQCQESARRVLPSIHMALAKLGEEEEIDVISSDLRGENPKKQNDAVQKLTYIGGPIAMKLLMSLLEKDKFRAYKHNLPPNGDLTKRKHGPLFYPLQRYALRALPLIVENPPVSPRDGDILAFGGSSVSIEEQVKIWKQWYEENKDSLERVARQ